MAEKDTPQPFFIENPDGTVDSIAGDSLQTGSSGASQAGIGPATNPPIVPSGAVPVKARLRCHGCSKLLEYDAGAQYVQCFNCSVMNAVQPNNAVGGRVLSMLCAICHTTNLAPYGINFVRCGTCSTISQVSHAYRQQEGAAPAATGQQSTTPLP